MSLTKAKNRVILDGLARQSMFIASVTKELVADADAEIAELEVALAEAKADREATIKGSEEMQTLLATLADKDELTENDLNALSAHALDKLVELLQGN